MSRSNVLHRLLIGLGRFMRETRGSIALKFAFVGPAIFLLGVGAIDLLAVSAAQGRLQSIADAGALAGAPALALATDGAAAKERAASFVAAQMSQWADAPEHQETYEIVDQGGQRAIRVLLRGHRPSFFANMLPPGGWHFIGDATASSVSLVPLCVLTTGNTGSRVVNIQDSGRLRAPACMVHSNRDIAVEGGALEAAAVQAVTSATGAITPSPGTGAAPIDDPFANLAIDDGVRCPRVVVRPRLSGVVRLAPGTHCGGLIIGGTAELVLEPGEHLFKAGALLLGGQARLSGTDVVLFFDTASWFEFRDRSMVNLTGRQTGEFAGLVMAATRNNVQNFVVSSDNVETLLGVIYVPSARLVVEGRADVARDSAWTVIVAKELRMIGSPSLFINADYNASSVPVPAGVGPRTGGSRLIQ